MASTSIQEKKRLRVSRMKKTDSVFEDELVIVVFDIEGTGKYLVKNEKDDVCDEVFAIGWRTFTVQRGILEKGRICLDLGKSVTESWGELWQRKGYEERCYREF